MKKLFSIITLLVFIIGLAGCTKENTDTLDEQIRVLQQEVADLEADVLAKDSEIQDLQDEIVSIQESIYDNIITFTFINEYGRFASSTVGYDDDFEGTLFDILDANYLVDYTTSEYGVYITKLEDLTPRNGSYISIYKNGVPSMVGIEMVTFSHTDVFTFQVEWYDETEEMVFNAINLFLNNQVDNYTSETLMSLDVVAGLAALGMLDQYVDNADVVTYLDNLTPTTVQDYFKFIVLAEATNAVLVSSPTQTLNSMVTVGGYGQTAYGLLAFNSGNTTEDYSVFEVAALADLNTNTPLGLGLDAGGISLVALSDYAMETGVDALISDYASWISDDQLESGGILTREMVWGGITYPGTENAASISQVILGLVANNIDPTGVDYTKTNGDLVYRLTEFQLSDGSFDWDLTDDITNDLAFSTPQAFLALATYYAYSNGDGTGFNPFDFTE